MKKLVTASIKIPKRKSIKSFIEELNSILGDEDFTDSYIETVRVNLYEDELSITCIKNK